MTKPSVEMNKAKKERKVKSVSLVALRCRGQVCLKGAAGTLMACYKPAKLFL